MRARCLQDDSVVRVSATLNARTDNCGCNSPARGPLKPLESAAALKQDYICVTTVQEIEQAIAKLPREGFFELVRHLRERHAQEWDRQIEEDAESGKLREAYRRLDAENQGQPEMPLDDFLDNEKLS